MTHVQGYTMEEISVEIKNNIQDKYVESLVKLCEYISTIKDTNVLRISMNPVFPYNLVPLIHNLYNYKDIKMMKNFIDKVNDEIKNLNKEEYITQQIRELLYVKNYDYESELRDLEKYVREQNIEDLDNVTEEMTTVVYTKCITLVNMMIHNNKREKEISKILSQQ